MPEMLTDKDLRGRLLQKFYDVRHDDMGGRLGLPKGAAEIHGSARVLDNIAAQLRQHGLIEYDAGLGGGGSGSITAKGVDVIEGNASPPIAITVHHHDSSIAVHGSQGVQIGNNNTQSGNTIIGQISQAVDQAQATSEEKAEAKSILAKVAENPLLASIVGAAVPLLWSGIAS